jgi:biotin carboxyl carrier protein
MPGRVVRVLVEEGQEVEQGQGVLVLEAMKMENEVAAPRAGTVGRIRVSTGDKVETGEELAVID